MLAFAASFFARGYLAGEGHFGLLAGLLVSESFSRMAFSLAVAVGIAAGRNAVAAGVVAAPLLLAVGRAARVRPARRPRPAAARRRGRATRTRARSWRAAGRSPARCC